MKFAIEDKVLQVLVNYLITKPFVEVNQIIQELQRLPKIEEVPNSDQIPNK